MTIVVDISCPRCGDTDVRKESIGRYRCGECGLEFDQADVDPRT